MPSFAKNLTDAVVLGIFHTIGNVCTLYSLSLLSVPLVLTIKATEPIFAMLLLKFLRLQDSKLNASKCIAMFFMVAGTIMATVKEVEFEMTAFVASVMANFGFQMIDPPSHPSAGFLLHFKFGNLGWGSKQLMLLSLHAIVIQLSFMNPLIHLKPWHSVPAGTCYP